MLKKRVHLQPHGHGGYVTREATVWCCSCERWQQEPSPAVSTWLRSGWRKTKDGWQCQACQRRSG